MRESSPPRTRERRYQWSDEIATRCARTAGGRRGSLRSPTDGRSDGRRTAGLASLANGQSVGRTAAGKARFARLGTNERQGSLHSPPGRTSNFTDAPTRRPPRQNLAEQQCDTCATPLVPQNASGGDLRAAGQRRWSRHSRSETVFEQHRRLQNARSVAAGPANLLGGSRDAALGCVKHRRRRFPRARLSEKHRTSSR